LIHALRRKEPNEFTTFSGLTQISQNQIFATIISASNPNQITTFKMLSYTVFQVLLSYVRGFGPKKYLSTSDFGKKHNNSNTFASSKYGNFLQHALRLEMHLVHIHNLPDPIW